MQKELLLISLFICHWLADYSHLSTAWMLNAKRLGTPTFPILCHACVHAILMSTVLKCFGFSWIIVACSYTIQLSSHYLIDVWKGKMNSWFPKLQNPTNKWHWIIFGFDQLLHAIVIVFMAYFAISKSNS